MTVCKLQKCRLRTVLRSRTAHSPFANGTFFRQRKRCEPQSGVCSQRTGKGGYLLYGRGENVPSAKKSVQSTNNSTRLQMVHFTSQFAKCTLLFANKFCLRMVRNIYIIYICRSPYAKFHSPRTGRPYPRTVIENLTVRGL